MVKVADGTELPCLCNLHTLGVWCEQKQLALSDLEEALQKQALSAVPDLIWLGIKTAHELEEKEVPVTELKFKVVFGSSDWQPVVENIGKALNFLQEGSEKKKKDSKAES